MLRGWWGGSRSIFRLHGVGDRSSASPRGRGSAGASADVMASFALSALGKSRGHHLSQCGARGDDMLLDRPRHDAECRRDFVVAVPQALREKDPGHPFANDAQRTYYSFELLLGGKRALLARCGIDQHAPLVELVDALE